MKHKPIRVLIVDDSVFMRSMLRNALERTHGIEVIDTAQNGTLGLKKILALKPDVVTLDIEMPGMSGLEVIDRVMKECPTAIVVVSTKTQAGAKTTLDALERGAVDYVAKPLADKDARIESFREKVVRAVLAAAASNRCSLVGKIAPREFGEIGTDVPLDAVVAIGISAGGPQTLHQILPTFPRDFPPILITQHMPADFTKPLADRLNLKSRIEVKEARHASELLPGTALIAPGNTHLRVTARGPTRLAVVISSGPKVGGFRPSVDVMFDSLASACPERTVAIVMTGMGTDGAAGLELLKKKGAHTLAQDQASSVVFGMPKAAFKTGCVDHVVALSQIPRALADGARSLLAVRR